jgi:hypothetical protein
MTNAELETLAVNVWISAGLGRRHRCSGVETPTLKRPAGWRVADGAGVKGTLDLTMAY